jgi:hypothetical protein
MLALRQQLQFLILFTHSAKAGLFASIFLFNAKIGQKSNCFSSESGLLFMAALLSVGFVLLSAVCISRPSIFLTGLFRLSHIMLRTVHRGLS